MRWLLPPRFPMSSRSKDKYGVCVLCQEATTLTFEHLPPRSAWNNARVQQYDVIPVDGEGLVAVPGRYQQRGAGGYLLCADCNNLCGRQYVRSYSDFAAVCALALRRISGLETLADQLSFPYFEGELGFPEDSEDYIYPGRVAKQAVAMLLCAAGPDMAAEQPELREYVLNRSAPLPDGVQLGFCLLLGDTARSGSMSTIDRSGEVFLGVEVSFSPLAWVLCLQGSLPQSVVDVTTWARYSYDDKARGLSEALIPIGFAATPFLLDYRTPAQIERDTQARRSPRSGLW